MNMTFSVMDLGKSAMEKVGAGLEKVKPVTGLVTRN